MAQRGKNGRRESINEKSLCNIKQESLTLDGFYFTNTVCNKVFSSLIVIVMLCNDCTNGGKVGEEGELCILCSYLARVHVYVLVFTNSYQCSPDG